MKTPSAKTIALSLVEFLLLLGLWELYVSNLTVSDLLVGIGAALLAATADAVVKSQNFAPFYPHLKWVAMILWEPWYVLTGTASIWWAVLRKLAGRRSEAQLKAIRFSPGGDDSESVARRALAITLTTIPPNFIVVGIDRQASRMLVHQVSPTPTPLVTKKLGAQE